MSSTPTTEQAKAGKAKRITGIIFNVILWIFLIFALVMMIFAFASNSNKYGVSMLGNKVILNVKSPSMEPTIMTGDMIVGTTLSDEEKEALKAKSDDYEGDIITFFVDLNGDGVKEINTHRIIEKYTNGSGDIVFRTKGDNPNNNPDNYEIRVGDIVCTWKEGDTQIHGLGSVIGFLQSRTGFLIFVIIPLIGLFVYEIVRLVMMIVKIKGKGKKDITDAEKEEIRRLAIEEYKRSLSGEETVSVQEGDDKGDATE